MKKAVVIIFILVCFATNFFAQTTPFPAHAKYTSTSILPTCYTQQQLDEHVMQFYNEWKKIYLKNDCGNNELYVWFQNAPNENNQGLSTSEAQGYGMLITIFMAGYNKDAQQEFDALYKYSRTHKSNLSKNFMAWKQETCIDSKEKDNTSATDGDFDIAYSLLLANKQWGSSEKINYLAEAKNIINELYENVINPSTNHILLGDWVDEESKKYNGTRTSDFMCNHFENFAKATNNPNWKKVIEGCYSLLDKVKKNQSITTGLYPDFMEDVKEHPTSAQGGYLETKYDGEYYYNACRLPFRIGLHYLLNNDIRAKKIMDELTKFIKKTTENDPQNIESGYFLNGEVISKSELNSSAFIGGIAIASMADTSNQAWLNNSYNFLLLQQLTHNTYYDNTLKMLYLIVLTGNWWSPN